MATGVYGKRQDFFRKKEKALGTSTSGEGFRLAATPRGVNLGTGNTGPTPQNPEETPVMGVHGQFRDMLYNFSNERLARINYVEAERMLKGVEAERGYELTESERRRMMADFFPDQTKQRMSEDKAIRSLDPQRGIKQPIGLDDTAMKDAEKKRLFLAEGGTEEQWTAANMKWEDLIRQTTGSGDQKQGAYSIDDYMAGTKILENVKKTMAYRERAEMAKEDERRVPKINGKGKTGAVLDRPLDSFPKEDRRNIQIYQQGLDALLEGSKARPEEFKQWASEHANSPSDDVILSDQGDGKVAVTYSPNTVERKIRAFMDDQSQTDPLAYAQENVSPAMREDFMRGVYEQASIMAEEAMTRAKALDKQRFSGVQPVLDRTIGRLRQDQQGIATAAQARLDERIASAVGFNADLPTIISAVEELVSDEVLSDIGKKRSLTFDGKRYGGDQETENLLARMFGRDGQTTDEVAAYQDQIRIIAAQTKERLQNQHGAIKESSFQGTKSAINAYLVKAIGVNEKQAENFQPRLRDQLTAQLDSMVKAGLSPTEAQTAMISNIAEMTKAYADGTTVTGSSYRDMSSRISLIQNTAEEWATTWTQNKISSIEQEQRQQKIDNYLAAVEIAGPDNIVMDNVPEMLVASKEAYAALKGKRHRQVRAIRQSVMETDKGVRPITGNGRDVIDMTKDHGFGDGTFVNVATSEDGTPIFRNTASGDYYRQKIEEDPNADIFIGGASRMKWRFKSEGGGLFDAEWAGSPNKEEFLSPGGGKAYRAPTVMEKIADPAAIALYQDSEPSVMASILGLVPAATIADNVYTDGRNIYEYNVSEARMKKIKPEE